MSFRSVRSSTWMTLEETNDLCRSADGPPSDDADAPTRSAIHGRYLRTGRGRDSRRSDVRAYATPASDLRCDRGGGPDRVPPEATDVIAERNTDGRPGRPPQRPPRDDGTTRSHGEQLTEASHAGPRTPRSRERQALHPPRRRWPVHDGPDRGRSVARCGSADEGPDRGSQGTGRSRRRASAVGAMIHAVDLARRPRPVAITRDGQLSWHFLGTSGARPSESTSGRSGSFTISAGATGWPAMLTPRRANAPTNSYASRGAPPRRSSSR
jgi:hypothetical protein